uniref:Tektin n=1 Tax=Falco tinnunculus TaxID=100819 RepID=A0A8C4UKB6_FALTI
NRAGWLSLHSNVCPSKSKPCQVPASISTMASSYKNCFPQHPLPQSFSLLWMLNAFYKAAAINSALAPFSRKQPPFTQYTPDDWYSSNLTNYEQSEASRHDVEHLRVETSRVIQGKFQQTKNPKNKSELCRELEEVAGASTLPQQPAVTACPQQVTQECVRHQEKRMGIDLVRDDVEKRLFTVSLATQIVYEVIFT